MRHFKIGRCQWILRAWPWYIGTIHDDDGTAFYRVFRQWFFGSWTVPRDRSSWYKGEPTMRCFSAGPIELRRFRAPLDVPQPNGAADKTHTVHA